MREPTNEKSENLTDCCIKIASNTGQEELLHDSIQPAKRRTKARQISLQHNTWMNSLTASQDKDFDAMKYPCMDDARHESKRFPWRLEVSDATKEHSSVSETDLLSEIHNFAENDDYVFEDNADEDVTASETDSSCSASHEETSPQDSDEGSCCTFYEDEDDLTCLLQVASSGEPLESSSKRGVRFSTVEVREYAVTLGDHPCTLDSCPVTLDWQHARGIIRDVNSYENSRYFVRNSYPRKLPLEERRRRIRETSRLSRAALLEMELDASMRRLEQPTVDMSEFWEEIDQQQATADPEGFWQSHIAATQDL